MTTLRDAKAKFSEMVKRASRGEEVVITVHGKETINSCICRGAARNPIKKNGLKSSINCAKRTGLADMERVPRKYRTKIAQIGSS
jgi:hypothetical protein